MSRRLLVLPMVMAMCVLAVSTWAGSSAETRKGLGLTVSKDGVLMKGGKAFKGIGVNYFDAFFRTLSDPSDTSYRQGFKDMADYKIPFARIIGAGFWPSEYKLYREDKEGDFKLMDGVVKSAEENGVGLIPSLFWSFPTVPDMVGESCDQWGNPNSKTIAFMRQYVKEFVNRYKDSPAIWGWEFGNEYNLSADLPNASEHRPPIVPALGTATSRSEKDELTTDMIRSAFTEFAKEVRKYDKNRIIVTGNGFPRSCAWHLRKERSWTDDSVEQYKEMLNGDNPDPADTFCVHLYDVTESRFGNKDNPAAELLKVSMEASKEAKKPLFVGEFGAPDSKGPEVARARFAALLNAIEQDGVPFAALWDYGRSGHNDSYNVTATNSRSYQLQMIKEANERIQH